MVKTLGVFLSFLSICVIMGAMNEGSCLDSTVPLSRIVLWSIIGLLGLIGGMILFDRGM